VCAAGLVGGFDQTTEPRLQPQHVEKLARDGFAFNRPRLTGPGERGAYTPDGCNVLKGRLLALERDVLLPGDRTVLSLDDLDDVVLMRHAERHPQERSHGRVDRGRHADPHGKRRKRKQRVTRRRH
jgi:hypothetical protein